MECGLERSDDQRMQLGMVRMRGMLDASLAEGLERVWLIDPTRYPTVAECAKSLGMPVEAFDALTNLYTHYAPSLREWGPRLLPASDAAVEPVLEQAVEVLAASLLVAHRPLDLVAAHLSRLIKLPQLDGSRLLFRFQDPLVMANLMPLLDQRQQRALLGPPVLVQGHEGQDLDIVGELGKVDFGAVALDDLAALQGAVARVAGAGRQSRLGGQLEVAHAALLLQGGQDLEVDPVDLVRLARGHAIPPAGPMRSGWRDG